MGTVRGVAPNKRGTGYACRISDPFQKRQREFYFGTEAEATAKKLDTVTKIKAIQSGHFTVPPNVVDIVLWLVKDGKKGIAQEATKPTTVTEVIAAYLARQRARVVAGGEEGISPGRFGVQECYLRRFQEFCQANDAESIQAALSAANLEAYKLDAAGHYPSKYTLAGVTSTVKALITWAWETDRIDTLPRNLAKFRRVTTPDPVALVYTKSEVLDLYQHGSPTAKLCLLLALNGGYTQQDIADLRHDTIDWENGIIDACRGKIKKVAIVPRRVKLWPSTLQRLRLHATDPSISDLVLLTRTGQPLTWRKLRDDGKAIRVDSIKLAFNRLQLKRKIKGRTFKHFRRTGADLVKNRYVAVEPGAKTNAQLFDMYLAHKPPKIKLHYDPGDWRELHKATDWLGETLGLFDGGNLDGSG